MRCPIFLLVLFSVLPYSVFTLPRFEVYWESEFSYEYTGADAPWHINLDEIDVGVPGYLGPNVVTILAADYCTVGCQENYPDEFCSKYPPEGIPGKPRTVDDWGTKFNITANIMERGIDKIHKLGGKVNLAYGGYYGISAENGGGSRHIAEDRVSAYALAQRIAKNVFDWDLDGVDFYYNHNNEYQYWVPPEEEIYYDFAGTSPGYHISVIRNLHQLFTHTGKTISFTTNRYIALGNDIYYPTGVYETTFGTVIKAAHPFIDWISWPAGSAFDDDNLWWLTWHGIPYSKIVGLVGVEYCNGPSEDFIVEWTDKIKDLGLGGLKLNSINRENAYFSGQYVKMLAYIFICE